MTKDKVTPIDSTELRRQAEDRLGEQNGSSPPPPPGGTEKDLLRLHHELLVHQIELEMQNSELQKTRDELETALGKYTDLYDFSPVGYFTLDNQGVIRTVNLSGAELLGVERSRLLGQSFGLFVAAEARTTFADFLGNVFTSLTKETCEVALLKEGNSPLVMQVEAVVSESRGECYAVVIDITERKLAMEALRKVEIAAEVARLMVENATATALHVVEEAAEVPQTEKEALDIARLMVEKATEVARLIVEENAEMPQNMKEKEATEFARLKVDKAAEVARQMMKTAAEVAHRRVEERAAERKRVSTALHECEGRFQLLIDGIKDYAIIHARYRRAREQLE